MTKLMPRLLLSGLVSLAVPACDQQESLSGADLDSALHKVKPGNKFGLPFGVCEHIVGDAQLFFEDQLSGTEREVFATELKARLDTGQTTMIVDVRAAPDYSAAHIPTSVNMPLDVLFTQGLCPNGNGTQCDGNDLGNCKQVVLPRDGTPIVLVSSNGHAASMAAGVLGALSYNVYVLRFGMISWAKSTDVQVPQPDRTQRLQGLGGPLEL